MTTTRESEWDDESRAEMLGLAEYESGICPGCGFHKSVTSDKRNVFSFEVEHCAPCSGWARYGRLQAKDDAEEVQKFGDNIPPQIKRPSDGRKVYMQMTRPT